MKSPTFPLDRPRRTDQQGVVLFFSLIALLAMSLAAVALIRSVDTSTLIAGNLSFRQAATSSSDAGTEAAIAWLKDTQLANSTLNVFADATHPFNVTNLATRPGYHANASSALNLTDPATWNNSNSVLLLPDPDSSGNSVRYIIQRMCRTTGLPTTGNCLFGVDPTNTNPESVPLPPDVCEGAGCPVAGRSPQFRITTRTQGPRNTVSYIQAFVN